MQFNFIALDAALSKTGFAVYNLSTDNFEFRLLEFGQIETNVDISLDVRVRFILRKLYTLALKYDCKTYFVEEPTLALFGKRPTTSIIPLFAVVFGIVGFCHVHNFFVRLLHSQTWQAGRHKKLGMDSKEWSIRTANDLLTYLKFPVERRLKGKDHNIADAINIGIYCIKQLQSKEWIMPHG